MDSDAFFKPTIGQFLQMFPKAGALQYQALVAACVEFELWTPERVAAAFAQWHHESVGLTRLVESFAFTPERLRQVHKFRVRSTLEAQSLVSRGPEAIANHLYGGRFGNVKPGDGWKYRGRGPTQLTFHANYAEAGEALNLPLAADPDKVAFIEIGARVSAYYWHKKGCNQLADDGNFLAITRKVNGGENGLADRTAKWEAFRTILGLPGLPQEIRP